MAVSTKAEQSRWIITAQCPLLLTLCFKDEREMTSFFSCVVEDTSGDSRYVLGRCQYLLGCFSLYLCLLLCISRGQFPLEWYWHTYYETSIHWQELFPAQEEAASLWTGWTWCAYHKTVKPSTKLHFLLRMPFQLANAQKQADEEVHRRPLQS